MTETVTITSTYVENRCTASAENSGGIIGHIAFSPATIDGKSDGWFGLGPISVHPSFQRSGIGTRLVHEGLSMLKARGAKGCALIGNPDYYRRFGFVSDGRLSYGDIPQAYVQWLSFGHAIARGRLAFSSAFERQYPS